MARSVACTVRTGSRAETVQFGAELGARIRHGVCVCLSGPLGAGKTALVSGLCRGLGVTDPVVSPTFILLETFAGRLPVVHVDLYRLEHERELEDIGVFDTLGTGAVVLAEWGERSPGLFRAADIAIDIEPGDGDARTLVVSATPPLAADLAGCPW
jgi:tRNA threonylcarbamoyladenosine biosynthesis protein TsaE